MNEEGAGGYELFYSTGGHGGPYPTVAAAEFRARELLRGNRSEQYILIVTRASMNRSRANQDVVRAVHQEV